MRLIIVALLCLSLAAVAFGSSSDQAIVQISSYIQRHYEAVGEVVKQTNSRFSTRPKVQDASACEPLMNQLLGNFQNDQNCMRLFSSFGDNPLGNRTTPGAVGLALDAICTNPCYPALINAMKQITACLTANTPTGGNSTSTGGSIDADMFDKIFGLFCMKNPANDQYCLSMMTDPALLNVTNGRRVDNNTVCDVFGQFGCCINPVFEFVERNEASSANSVRETLRTACGFTPPPACPRPGASVKFAKATWRIKGLAYLYFRANEAALKTALRADIAARVGCDKGYIAFTAFREGSVIADFNIRGQSDTETTNIATALATASADTATAFPNTASVAGTAGVDAGQTVGIDTTQSTSSVITYTAPGSGTNVQPMFALVAALLAFTIFARQ
jgi:hypothetical protein